MARNRRQRWEFEGATCKPSGTGTVSTQREGRRKTNC
jgi:hypothetical protein